MGDKIKNNKLESFVQNNREAFDDAVPSLKIWTEIERELGKEKQNTPTHGYQLRRHLKVAAAVLFLLFIGGIIGNYIGSSSPSSRNSLSGELAEIETFYKKQVSEKYAQLTKLNHDKSVDTDLQQIDDAIRELKEDMVNEVPGTKEKLIANIIKSYQLKINILKMVLERTQENKQEQNNNKNAQISL